MALGNEEHPRHWVQARCLLNNHLLLFCILYLAICTSLVHLPFNILNFLHKRPIALTFGALCGIIMLYSYVNVLWGSVSPAGKDLP